jgi:ribosomal protein S18 acetylase RimI-like enzyme
VRVATAADGPIYERDIGTDSAATFTIRLTEQTRCFVVEAPGPKLVHATWVTTSAAWTRELGGYLVVPPGDAYVYESFTRPDARGRGIYPLALAEICRELAAEGIERVWVGVEEDNEPSIRAVTKTGFRESFRIRYRRKFGHLQIDPIRYPPPPTLTLAAHLE